MPAPEADCQLVELFCRLQPSLEGFPTLRLRVASAAQIWSCPNIVPNIAPEKRNLPLVFGPFLSAAQILSD